MPNPTSKLNLVINGTTTQLDIHDANAVDLTNNQTVAGNKEFTGTTTAHDLVPSATDTYNLGTSTNKWKTFNGVNPGALSLPSNNTINILSALQSGGYTAPSDGYVRAIKNVQTDCTATFGIRNETTQIEDRKIAERLFLLGVMVPVQKGEKVVISDDWQSVGNANITYSAYFYPCQGNV